MRALLFNSIAMDRASYSLAHEAFVSDHGGSSLWTLLSAVLQIVPLVFILAVVQGDRAPSFWLDYCVVTLPQLMALTAFANETGLILLLLIAFVVALVAFKICCMSTRASNHINSTHVFSPSKEDETPMDTASSRSREKVRCLSLFKGATMLLTCIAILAVDFQIFPRFYAKTETYGISLMDVGIGTFISSSALTSRYARGGYSPRSTGAPFCPGATQKLAVLLLGIGRFATLKLMKYHSHVSEYGSEWNFFVTLYFLWLLADLVHLCLSRESSAALGVVLIVSYQCALLNTPLTEYILNAPRLDWLSSNREGICSLAGCLALFLTSEYLSHMMFFKGLEQHSVCRLTPNSDYSHGSALACSSDGLPSVGDKVSQLKQSIVLSLAFWMLWMASEQYQLTSRRLFNLPFVILNLFIVITGITCLLASEVLLNMLLGVGEREIKVLELLSKHQLSVFLVANLLTGAVNVLFPTIYMGATMSLCLLSVYMFLVHLFAWSLDRWHPVLMALFGSRRLD